MRVRRWAALAAASAVLVGASGCGGDGSDTATDDPTDSVAEAPTEAKPSEDETSEEPEEVSGGYDRDELIAAMQAALAGQESAHMVMEFSGGGQSMTGEGDVSYAEGKQAMQMTMTAGAMGTIEMRLVDGVMYMAVPPMTPKGKFVRIDPAEGGPLGDFGGLSQGDPLAAFEDFETGLEDVTYVGPESVDGVDADHYVLTVDAKAAAEAQGGPTQGVPEEVTYDLWLDEDDLMRRMQFSLPQGSFTMTMSDWGEPVKVKAPAKRDIVTMPGAPG